MQPPTSSPIMTSPISNLSALQNLSVNNQAPVSANSQETSQGSTPNTLEKLLPTLGGIGGGLLGDVLGPLGGIGGAALGDAAGKAAENYFTHGDTTKDIGNGLLGAAAEGGIGQGVGEGLGAVAGKVLGGVSGLAQKAIPGLLVKQSGDMLDQDTAKYLADNGITDFKDAVSTGKQLTGAPGGEGAILSNAVKTAADGSPASLDMTHEATNWTTPLENYPDVNGAPQQAISRGVNKVLTKMVQDSGGKVDTVLVKNGENINAIESGGLQNVKPGAALEAAQTLRRMANTVGNGARDATGTVINSSKAAAQDTYNNLASAIEQKALGTDLEGNTAMPLSDADKQLLKDSLSDLGKTNPTLYKSLSDQIDNASNWQDIRSMQQPFVKVSQAAKAAANAANKANGQGAADISKGVVGLATNPMKAAAGVALNHPAADTAAAGLLSRLSKAAGSKTAKTMIPLLLRTNAVTSANLPNDVAAPVNAQGVTGTAIPASMNAGTEGTTTMPTSNPYSTLVPALEAQTILDPSQYGSSAGSTLSSILPNYMKQQLLTPAITNAESGFENAGGAQGLGGILSKLSGLVGGTPANTYNQQQAAAADALAQLLGITPQAAMGMLPQLMQNTQTAATSVSGLNSVLGNLPQATPVQ